MPANPLTLATQFRAQLQRLDAAALQQLIAAYAPIRRDMDLSIDSLLMDIELMQSPTAVRVRRSDRYKKLIDSLGDRLTEFSLFLLVAMRGASGQGSQLGALNGAQMLGGLGLRPATVNYRAIEALAAFLDPSGPLYKRIQVLAPFTVQRVSDAILDGVSLGQNPAVIALGINRALGVGLTDSLRMTRTVQIYSYRYANHATYMANDIATWTWFSRLDPARTCMSCVQMHGTVHSAAETLNDHHSGLCIPIPNVANVNLVGAPGEDWFNQQNAATQAQMMGPGKYDAWKAGKLDFGNLSTTHNDPVYGEMRVAAPLKELVK